MFAQLIICGNAGRKPELRATPNGKQVCNISVAVNSNFAEKDKTDWYTVTVWGKTAEFAAKYIDKGSTVLASGRPTMREYQGNDGVTKIERGLEANDIKIVSSKRAEESSIADVLNYAAPAVTQKHAKTNIPTFDGDIPF